MVDNHYRWDFIGLSTDEKPTPETSEKVANGSTFYCSDNSKLYVWYKTQWYEKVVEGGGGGTSYTAGDGINISNNEISVDTNTIQPKLTAGTNITIDANNVISAEGGGGSSVNVVQTMGTSTTDVMSQKATTTMIHPADDTNHARIAIGQSSLAPGTNSISIGYRAQSATGRQNIALGSQATIEASASNSISIGTESKCGNSNTLAIGNHAKAMFSHSVAIGSYAEPTQSGEVNIGSGTQLAGYNNSSYRLLTGLYDGQSAHDAVTVEQVNATIDAINAALSTSIPHIGA